MERTTPSPIFDKLMSLYRKAVLNGPMPAVVVFGLLAVSAFFAYHSKAFKMDASSDSIILENDPDMRAWVEAGEVYGSDEYVAIMLTPAKDLFSDETLKGIAALRDDLMKVPIVGSVTSILNVPLFHSPDVPLLKLATDYKNLEKEGVDKALALKELSTSPLFSDFLISKDGKTTILQVNFKPMPEYNKLYFDRFELREKKKAAAKEGRKLSPEDEDALQKVSATYRRMYEQITGERREHIQRIREIMKVHAGLGKLYLGGVPMVVADIVRYVQRDIVVFGVAVLAFVVLMLALLFRNLKLMLIPLVTCAMALVWMIGYLGITDWHTTIVTSNFSSLLLIMTTENAIHLATHWRELCVKHPEMSNRDAVFQGVRAVITPCAFSTFTTVVGFGSLMVSGIRPVMDFGLMMTIGLTVSLAICFTFMPAALALLPRGKEFAAAKSEEEETANVSIFARWTEHHPGKVVAVTLLVFALCALGTRRLTVENRFMDYFRSSTEVNKGMVVIDTELGGTMPMDILIDGDGPDYWLEPANLAKLRKVHEWLDALPESGKVVSLDTLVHVLEGINKGPVNKMLLGMVKSRLPQEMRKDILSPYVNADFSQARISMRMIETNKDMKREELLKKIRTYLKEESGFGDKARPVGMFLLYNNMLQTLFRSQILTVSTVLITCLITFSIVFRSLWLALIGLVPNILAVTTILGMIGWLGIPMDMMTVMIAAITFGLADDNTIHYIVRFKEEFPKDRNYLATMYRCHNSVGKALSYSMVTIVVGFAVLTASNFLPTVYFGIFTGIAMFLALIASHTILPLLIIKLKPLGKGPDAKAPTDAEAPGA